MLFALASIAAMSLQAVTLVSPKEGETMCLLNDGNRAFLEMDASARRKIFTDKAWRHEAATKWRSVPKPVTLRWADAKNGKVRVTVTKRGAAQPFPASGPKERRSGNNRRRDPPGISGQIRFTHSSTTPCSSSAIQALVK